MTYAIVEIGGRQVWVQLGKFYDVNKLHALPGEVISLNRVLLVNRDGEILIGNPCLKSYTIRAKVLRHVKSKKVTVFKMKSKKNLKSKRGHRQPLTRLLIQKI